MEKKIKEIIFFATGDSSKASTWSNVPYMFTETLLRKGIKIDRVNLTQTFGYKLFTKVGGVIHKVLNLFYPNNQYAYSRSALFMFLTNRLVKKSVRRYHNADLCIFTNFDFYNKYSDIPTLMFCDWTYKILIQDHLGREPYFFEKRFPLWEKKALESADYVVSLFPMCAKMMKESSPNANIHYLGKNVVNNLYDGVHDIESFIKKKITKRNILFIGGRKYIDGAKLLINAVAALSKKYDDIRLHIVGMKEENFDNLPDVIKCYGYLRKEDEKERELYYELMIGSRIIVNPSKEWAGYSSMIEAMFFATPVVVSPYKDFVEEFGKDIDFGAYSPEYDVSTLANTICRVLESKDYPSLCRNAYERVKDYTWSNYVDRVLSLVK